MSALCLSAIPSDHGCGTLDPNPGKPVIENFIHSFGGISYDSDELIAAVFATAEAAQECGLELRYLYRHLHVEIDGQWLAVYLS